MPLHCFKFICIFKQCLNITKILITFFLLKNMTRLVGEKAFIFFLKTFKHLKILNKLELCLKELSNFYYEIMNMHEA